MSSADGPGVHLFVYGTLRRGLRLHRFLAGSRFVAEATLRGRLYDVGTYPALVLDREGQVWGEVWEVDATTLARLDRVEDHVPGRQDNLYERVDAVAVGNEGREMELQVYIWNRSIVGLGPILTGEVADYAQWIEGRVLPDPEPEEDEED